MTVKNWLIWVVERLVIGTLSPIATSIWLPDDVALFSVATREVPEPPFWHCPPTGTPEMQVVQMVALPMQVAQGA